MNLSNRQRVVKLLLNLSKHPSLILPYLHSNFIRRSNPIEQNTAWWSFLAIHEVDKRIKGKRVFEYGMGGSTLRWAERCLCFQRAEQFIRKNGFIVVDDFWRYEKLLQQNHARSVKVFESVGPCRFGVTSTAVFNY